MDKLEKIEPDEISIKELIRKLKSSGRYLKSRSTTFFWFGFSGVLVAILYLFIQTPKYKAVSTFVLQETSHGGGLSLGGQYSGIASLAGIDIGGGSEKGLFQGDNILELYKSRLMIEKTLLSPVEIGGKKQLLIDRYIKANHSWFPFNQKDITDDLSFSGNSKKFSRLQDSVIREIVKHINKYILTVSKPDKKLSLISVEIKFKDEIFAVLFNKTLVQNVNFFYVQTQTSKTVKSLRVLQHQADSVRYILDKSLGKAAASTDSTPNANPAIHALQVPSQKRQIDVQANTAIYAEVVKNLEVSKITLNQETPLIQLIDEPILPLDVDKVGKLEGAFLGLIGGLLCGLIYITAGRAYIILKKL